MLPKTPEVEGIEVDEEEVSGAEAKSFSKRAGRFALLTTPLVPGELLRELAPGNNKLAVAVAYLLLL